MRDKKYNAGADAVIRRNAIRPGSGKVKLLKTNVEVPSIPVGSQTLLFLPDRVLVVDPRGVGAVPYSDLIVSVSATRFIETDSVPRDSQVVEHTWRYVNKKGGPDKRFKDNPRIPIAEYEEIHLTSATGLNELLQASRRHVGEALKGAVARMAMMAESSSNPLTDRSSEGTEA